VVHEVGRGALTERSSEVAAMMVEHIAATTASRA